MRNAVDTNFTRTILILVGAILIFGFWFMHDRDNAYPSATPITGNDIEVDEDVEDFDSLSSEALNAAVEASNANAATQ